ncbi:hypothetical protein PHSC3_000891 [Chlamydiales bacterium STE3]|nr:hypothetical protein PHSC3_000891 [Chlamydiales bacterium STE3]
MKQTKDLQKVIESARECYDHFLYWPHYYKKFPPIECSVALKEVHKEKNHALFYAYPFDHNLLTTIPYFNASPMQFGANRYIASQGPRHETLSDFWEMIWGENSELIVSVTNEREEEGMGHRYKFDAFWPQHQSQEFGNFKVALLKDEVIKRWDDGRVEQIRLRQCEVTYQGEKKIVHQLHMENWMDGSIVYPESLIELSLSADRWKGEGPILVHCAAGIGRTGTFIAFHSLYHDLLNALKRSESHAHFDILKRVAEMREKRYGPMIAAKIQFLLLVEALDLALLKLSN